MASVLNAGISLRSAKHDNNEIVNNAFCLASPSVTYYDATISASTDLFAGKTNKYIESKIILVSCTGKGVHLAFSADGLTAATTSHFYVAPDQPPLAIAISDGYRYLRVIENAATANIWVTEVY